MHADDLGISLGVNAGIFDAHKNGVVTSASLLTGGEHIEAALLGLKSHQNLDTGIHLCLHDERPVSAAQKISSLVGENGRLRALGQVIKRLAGGSIKSAEIEAEYKAQVERAWDQGLQITHIDSHCHLHAFPVVAQAAVKVARCFGIRYVRRPQALFLSDFAGAPPQRYPLSCAITLCSLVSTGLFGRDFRSADRFIGLVHSGGADVQWILRAMSMLTPGTTSEIMVHPGDGSDHGGGTADSHGQYQRKAEYDLLRSQELLAEIKNRQIELTSYRQLLP